MNDFFLKLKIGFKYMLFVFTQFIMSYWLNCLSYAAMILPDKSFITLVFDKSAHIVNVVRKYYPEITRAKIPYEEDQIEHRIENFTYAFRYFFENIAIDGRISFDNLRQYFDFDQVVIDYIDKDNNLIKKIIGRTDSTYHLLNDKLEIIEDIPFGKFDLARY